MSTLARRGGPAGLAGATLPLTYDSKTRTVSVNVGTGPGSVAAGDDPRVVGAAQKAANLADVASPGTARANLGGVAAVMSGACREKVLNGAGEHEVAAAAPLVRATLCPVRRP